MKMLTLSPRKKSMPVRSERMPASPPIKLFYRIQEVADLTGLKPSVLRYWETEFRELSPEKDASDQRRYRPSDVEVVKAIRKLLYEDRFTIKGARGRLREELRRQREAKVIDLQPAVEPKPKPAVTKPATVRPSVTEFRSQRSEPREEATRRRLNQTLLNLRLEVHALLNMLA